MPHDDIRAINDALRDLPLLDRIAALCASVIHEEPRAPFAICVLVEVAKILTQNLEPSQQTVVRWHLEEVITELRTRWH